MIRWLAIVGLLAVSGTASAQDMALLQIRIERYENFFPYVCDETPPAGTQPGHECVPIGGFVQYHVTLMRSFAGSVPQRSFVMLFPMAHAWSTPNTFYVLTDAAEHKLTSGGKYILVQDWAPVKDGFCLLEGESGAQYGIAEQVAALRRDHPCKEN